MRKRKAMLDETKRKIGLASSGEHSSSWKGDEVGYFGLHARIKKILKKPLKCNFCGRIKPLDLANKSHEYKFELDDWVWLCRKCHVKYDWTLKKTKRMRAIASKNIDIIGLKKLYATGKYTQIELGKKFDIHHITVWKYLHDQ